MSFLFIHRSSAPPVPHSFPTRRSSDLPTHHRPHAQRASHRPASEHECNTTCSVPSRTASSWRHVADRQPGNSTVERGNRSEEHTSELQSHSDLVCRLLLEKKKKCRDWA